TTLTPRISLSGSWLRSDTVAVAQDFVASPTRLTFGAQLRGDLYGFFPGFGSFEQIRHKVSPSFSYDYAPATNPTDLQNQVFGASARRAQNVLAVTLNQTFEAKRRPEREEGDSTSTTGGSEDRGRSTELLGGDGEELRRIEQGEVVSLLALRTSAIQYDFVQADSLGDFIDGFRTTTISNTLSSDVLSGFSVQMQHDLFDQEAGAGRTFAPKLTRLNFGFRLDNNSPVANLFGLLGDGERTPEQQAADSVAALADEEPEFEGDEFGFGGGSESRIIPNADEVAGRRDRSSLGGPVGRWSADLQYALTRSRGDTDGSQTVQARFQLKPTQLWEMSWATGFDIDTGEFSDHRIRLTRDLHRWEANFDFVQTATGNWSFRFEVRLSDQQDLKFDYEQRSLRDDFFGNFPR
ncbi:MAG TPA: putative LPS assembly protein LptD, partial [Longimicrobiales bacterium]|nr:putative LPS assembly protein LptD [Longimicrobiales bacterium]